MHAVWRCFVTQQVAHTHVVCSAAFAAKHTCMLCFLRSPPGINRRVRESQHTNCLLAGSHAGFDVLGRLLLIHSRGAHVLTCMASRRERVVRVGCDAALLV
jgi:hypothetical protein